MTDIEILHQERDMIEFEMEQTGVSAEMQARYDNLTSRIQLAEAVAEIRKILGSNIFGARFRKRDGTLRTGSFRLGVHKDLTGAGLSYDPAARGNLIVYDMTKRAYRTIRLDAVEELTVRGRAILP